MDLVFVFRFIIYFFIIFSSCAGNCDISQHLIPEDHPAKPILDALFSQSRATLDIKSMKKTGFIDPYPRAFTHIIVTRHPDLPGYILKLYLDAQRYFKKQTEEEHLLKRAEGAELIRNYIQENNLEHLFKVPKKWIYSLPDFPKPPKEFLKKKYILLVEDMDLVLEKDNKKLWSSDLITYELLHSLFGIINSLGLYDCGKIDNIPFAQDGRVAFIDTESYGVWPVSFKKLTPKLSKELKSSWNQIIHDN